MEVLMNFLSKIALFATLSTVVCSGFAMDTTPRDVVNATSEATSAAVEFAKENPRTAALLGTAVALGTYFAAKWFGGSKVKAVTPVVTVTPEVESTVENKPASVNHANSGLKKLLKK